MDDATIDDREHRANLFDLGVGHRKEIPIENRQVRELAGLDRADLIFHPEEPAVRPCEQRQRLFARELLAGIDGLTERIQPGRRVVDVLPRIQRRDVDAVTVDPGLDATPGGMS